MRLIYSSCEKSSDIETKASTKTIIEILKKDGWEVRKKANTWIIWNKNKGVYLQHPIFIENKKAFRRISYVLSEHQTKQTLCAKRKIPITFPRLENSYLRYQQKNLKYYFIENVVKPAEKKKKFIITNLFLKTKLLTSIGR